MSINTDYNRNVTRDIDNDPTSRDIEPMSEEELDDFYHQLMDEASLEVELRQGWR